MKAALKTENSLDVTSLFLNDSYSDCAIKSSDGKVFKAHRLVLAKRTDVFDAMLTSDMIEGKLNVISLHENAHVVTLMLRLMYGLKCDGSMKDFMDLSVATKKYLIMDLHEECLTKLATFLNSSHAIELLIFTFDNEFNDLMNQSMMFIIENSQEIYSSKSWNHLFNHPEVVRMVLDMHVNKFHQMVDQERKKYSDKSLSPVDIVKSKVMREEIKIEMENLELKKTIINSKQAALKEEQAKNQMLLNQIMRSRLRDYAQSFRECLPAWYICLIIIAVIMILIKIIF